MISTRLYYPKNKNHGFSYEKYGKPCADCGAINGLTRHHLKDNNGFKTGEIQILCRPCHDEAELEYQKLGIIETTNIKLTDTEKLEMQYRNGLIPYYSIYANFKKM